MLVVGETCYAEIPPAMQKNLPQGVTAPDQPCLSPHLPASARSPSPADLRAGIFWAPPLPVTQGHGSGSVCLQNLAVREVDTAAGAQPLPSPAPAPPLP